MADIPYVPVAGLRVPAPLVPRIIASMRGTYPTITTGLDDEPAVRAVLKHWVTSTLAAYEAGRAEAPVTQALADVQADFADKAEKARVKAQNDAASIQEAAAPVPDDPTGATDPSLDALL